MSEWGRLYVSNRLAARPVVIHLEKIEEEHDVKVLFAVEGGSRAWGFASANSDYDVRFLYAHEPEWYMRPSKLANNGVIQVMDEPYDIVGWDLRKALSLMANSNMSVLEWIQSMEHYRLYWDAFMRLREAAFRFFSCERASWHYWSMARNNYHTYIEGKEVVSYKRYLYVVRPCLALEWIRRHRTLPPIGFYYLLDGVKVPEYVSRDAIALVEMKKNGAELGEGLHLPALDEWIDAVLAGTHARLQGHAFGPPAPAGWERIDKLFLELVQGGFNGRSQEGDE